MPSLRRRVGRRRYGVIPLAVALVAGLGLAAARLVPRTAQADQPPPPTSLVGGVLSTTGSLQNTVAGLPSVASQVVSGLTQGAPGGAGGQVGVGGLLGVGSRASGGAKAATASSTGDGSDTGGGRAAALFTTTGLTLLGAVALMPPDSGICDTGDVPRTPAGTSAAKGLPGCNVALPLAPLVHLDVLTERLANGAASTGSTSQIASLRLLPDAAAGADVLDATTLTAVTSGRCGGQTQGSASILTLSIAGQRIVARSDNPRNDVVGIGGLATVTFDYTHVDHGTSPQTETASSVRIDFPADGALAALVKGTLFLSYAKSQGLPCAATPTPAPTEKPTPRPTESPTPTPPGSSPCPPEPTPTAVAVVAANDAPGDPADCRDAVHAAATGGGPAGGAPNLAVNADRSHAGAKGGASGALTSARVASSDPSAVPLAVATFFLGAGIALLGTATVRRRRRNRGFDRF